MKKIKFGSFPLIDMSKQDRQCIDSYSIKNYADLITLTSSINATTKSLDKYITPNVISKFFKTMANTPEGSFEASGSGKNKVQDMRRAFKNIKEFAQNIEQVPFYKNKKVFPIYLEHQNDRNNNFDYDFILLSNDLIEQQNLDEIKYNDKLTLMFLMIKDMLYPTIPLNEIGQKGNSSDIRKNIAQYIEFSKQNNMDPVTAMLKIVEVTAKNKQNKKYSSFSSTAIKEKMITSSISKKFTHLFDRGEIKSADFFMREVNNGIIHKFFNDTSKINKSSHTNVTNNPVQSTELERKYMLSKTHEYNKILSLVDGLIAFNDPRLEVFEESKDFLNHDIIVNDSKINVNIDALIEKLRGNYFEETVGSIITTTNNDYNFAINAISKKFEYLDRANNRGRSFSSINPFKEDKINDNKSASQQLHDMIIKESELEANIQTLRKQNVDVSILEINLGKVRRQIDRLNDMKMFEMINNNGKAKADETKKQQLQSNLTFNIGSIQGSLTSILQQFEMYVNDKEILQSILNEDQSKTNNVNDKFKDLNVSLNLLISDIIESFKQSAEVYFIEKLTSKHEFNNDSEITEVIDAYLNDKRIQNKLLDRVTKIVYNLFSKIKKDFGGKAMEQIATYNKNRFLNAPIIRKTISNSNNFKTFILSEEVLLNLYDILHHLDSQKYIAGLLAYPPSKISGNLLRMQYLIKRLGLNNNPVYIIQGSNTVILSSPDMLSLTSEAIFSKISFTELKEICQVDYKRDLWDNKKILKQLDSNNVSSDVNISRSNYLEQQKIVKKLMDNLKDAKKPGSNITTTELRAMEEELSTHKKTLESHSKAYINSFNSLEDNKHSSDFQQMGNTKRNNNYNNQNNNQNNNYNNQNKIPSEVTKFQSKQQGRRY